MDDRKLTRKAKVCFALLQHPKGISGREIDFKFNINSGKNEVYELQLINGLDIKREWVQGESGAKWIAFRIPNKAEAYKLIKLLNHERENHNLDWLTAEETNHYLAQFKGDL